MDYVCSQSPTEGVVEKQRVNAESKVKFAITGNALNLTFSTHGDSRWV